MKHAIRTRAVLGLCLLGLAAGAAAEGLQRTRRPMEIHRVAALGLEIWTEMDPAWETRLEQLPRAMFVAETPGRTYPPAGMTWASPGAKFSAAEFREAALGAVHQAARNYGLKPHVVAALHLQSATYGDLTGYESSFTAIADSTPVDVKVFFGHQPGKPAVAMQAFTLQGKLGHISENIRRSWSNVRYLK